MPSKILHAEIKLVIIRLLHFFSPQDVAYYLDVHQRTIERVMELYYTTGSIDRELDSLKVRGRPRSLQPEHILYMERLLTRKPDMYQDELQERLWEKFGIYVHRSTICRTIRREGLTYKKLSKHALERDENKRSDYALYMGSHFTADQLNFIDESSCNDRTTFRDFGYAKKGSRAIVKSNFVRGQRYSILPVLTLNGVLDVTIVKGSVTADIYEEFLEQVIDKMQPFPAPNSVLVMDNARIHRGERVKELAKARGIKLVYLPAYSPDFNPIEEGFSAVKAWIRRNGSYVRRQLQRKSERRARKVLTTAVLSSMTADKVAGWYRHSGYL